MPALMWCADPATEPCAQAVRDAKYRDAVKLCQEAAEALGGDPGRAGVAANLLGHARLRLGDYDGARNAYERSLHLARAAADDEAVAQRFNNLGSVDYFLGRYEDAERRYKGAATWIDQHRGAKWTAGLALGTAVNRAALLQRLRRDREALDLYLALRQSAHRLPPDDEGRLLANLGALYRALGDPVKARELYRLALDRFESAHGISGALKNLGIAEAVEFSNYAEARKLFGRVQAMARKSGDQREDLLAELYLAETAFREGKPAEARERWERSRAQAAKLGAAEEEWRALFGLGRVEEAAGEHWLRASIAKIESIRQQASAGAQRSGFLSDKRDVYDALLRRLLARGSVSDELLDTLERSRSRNIADQTFRITVPQVQALLQPDETLAIWWLTPQERQIVWLKRASSGIAKNLAEIPASSRLIMVPDGGVEGEPVERAWPEATEVAFLPAARLLLAPPASRRPATGLLVADHQLASVREETEDVARAMRLSWRRENGRAGVLAALGGMDLIHIAAHAEPDLEREERSRIRLADGPLVLGDVLKKKTAAELVTLAACETLRGRQARGEGVQSLASAFLRAGARSVVASRWPVNDAAARAFMQQFYAALANGESKSGALRTAKLRLKNSGGALAAPENWEAWVLYGDGRGRLAEPSQTWILFLAAAVAALAGVWWKLSTGRRAA